VKSRLAWSEQWRSIIATTLESLGVAAWEWDAASDRLWWSDNFGPLIGREPGFGPSSLAEAEALFEPMPEGPGPPGDILALAAAGDGPIEVEREAILPDGSTRWMLHRYSATFDDDGRATGLFGLVIDIDERRRRQKEETLLSEASRLLSASLDLEETLGSVAALLVPDLADWCVVELMNGDRLETALVAHADPEKVRWAHAVHAEYPQDMSAPMGSPNVIRTGEPELHPVITDDMLVAVAGEDERALEILREVGYRSVMVVPLQVRGETIGAVTWVMAGPKRRFDQAALDFARRLASQMAVAIENARLLREIEESGTQLARLHEATAKLSRAITEDDVARLALEVGMEATAARSGILFRVVDQQVTALAQRGFDQPDMGAWEAATAAGAGPVATALERGRAVFVDSGTKRTAELPSPRDMAPFGLGGVWASLPVHRTNGMTEVLALSFDGPLEFSPTQRHALLSLAEQTGVAMDRAHLLAHHREVALILQEGLQPSPLPKIEGVASAAVYVPSGNAEAGGDWYELFETADGTVIAVIGDVVGHGIPAVASMARVRHALSAHLFSGRSPADALGLTNAMVLEMTEADRRLTTAAVVAIDPARRRAVLAHAGHPPIAVKIGTGARLIEEPRGVPLGITEDATWSEQAIDLEPGTLLFLYTDGWIEYPGADPQQQLEAIRTVVGEAPTDPDAVLEAFQRRFASRNPADDAAALVVLVG
jgi:GAF domain-containing protein